MVVHDPPDQPVGTDRRGVLPGGRRTPPGQGRLQSAAPSVLIQGSPGLVARRGGLDFGERQGTQWRHHQRHRCHNGDRGGHLQAGPVAADRPPNRPVDQHEDDRHPQATVERQHHRDRGQGQHHVSEPPASGHRRTDEGRKEERQRQPDGRTPAVGVGHRRRRAGQRVPEIVGHLGEAQAADRVDEAGAADPSGQHELQHAGGLEGSGDEDEVPEGDETDEEEAHPAVNHLGGQPLPGHVGKPHQTAPHRGHDRPPIPKQHQPLDVLQVDARCPDHDQETGEGNRAGGHPEPTWAGDDHQSEAHHRQNPHIRVQPEHPEDGEPVGPDRHRPAERQVPASTLQGRRTISESTALGSGISGSTTWCAAIDQLGLERAGALDRTGTVRVRRGDVIDNRWAGHVSIASSARERLAAPGLMPLVSGGTANDPGCASSWSRWARSSASLVAVRTMPRSLSRAAKAT